MINDGNHRYNACLKLLNDKHIDLELAVNLVIVESEQDSQDIFQLVNTTVPLPTMPKGISLKIPNNVVEHFRKKFPKIFSSNKTCRRPHLTEREFTEHIGRIVEGGYNDATFMIKAIETYNNTLKNSVWTVYKSKKLSSGGKITSLVANATRKGGFYVGIFGDYLWMYNLFNIPFKSSEITSFKHIRPEVWRTYVGNRLSVICPCCNLSTINFNNWEAGHVVARAKGGSDDISNLRPICGGCNKRMGVTQMVNPESLIYLDA